MQQLLTATLLLFLMVPAKAQSAREERMQKRAMPAAKNIFSVSPIHGTEDNVGFGLGFEHFLDKTGNVSLYLPISYAIPQNRNYNGDDYYYSYYPGMSRQVTRTVNKGMVYFYPGIKVYPTGAHKKVSFAVGANLLAGFGTVDKITSNYSIDTVSTPGGGVYYNVIKDSENMNQVGRMKLGIMLNNNLSLRPSTHLYLGLEFAVGYTYLNTIDGYGNGSGEVIQAGIKFGYIK